MSYFITSLDQYTLTPITRSARLFGRFDKRLYFV